MIKRHYSDNILNLETNHIDPIANLSIEINPNFIIKYYRSYVKLFDILAYVGGIIYLIISAFRVIAEHLTTQIMVTEFSNKYIRIDTWKENNYSFHSRTSKEVLDNKHKSSNLNTSKLSKSEISTKFSYGLCDIFSIKNKRKKEINNKINRIIKGKLSTDYIFKIIEDFQKLKKLMMDNKQYILFETSKNKTIDQHLEDFINMTRNYDSSEVEECYDEVKRKTDILSRALIKEFNDAINF